VIVAGFQTGRRGSTLSAVFIAVLVIYVQAVAGLDGDPGFNREIILTMMTWAGFLVLTGYVVGSLSDQRAQRHEEIKHAYLTVMELLTFHLESAERQTRGHSYRVAMRSVSIAAQMQLSATDIENIRVAALLHELRPDDPRIARLFEHFPGETRRLPVVAAMRAALDIVAEYARYYSVAGGAASARDATFRQETKILAVADAFETLQLPNENRPPMSVWSALQEIQAGEGTMFSADAVAALRLAVSPQRSVDTQRLVAI
jgi:hypothetical protein